MELVLLVTTFGGLLSFLIWAVVACVVIYVIKLLLDMIPLPPPVKTIIYLIVGLIFLLFILNRVLGVAFNL